MRVTTKATNYRTEDERTSVYEGITEVVFLDGGDTFINTTCTSLILSTNTFDSVLLEPEP